MRFFIPSLPKSEAESVYLEMKRSLVDQLRFPIQVRRIFKLTYTDGKKIRVAEIGQFKPQENQYITVAIFEASVFIVMNRTTSGGPGPIVLVDKTQVTGVEDFLE